jgi:hypothetical protein
VLHELLHATTPQSLREAIRALPEGVDVEEVEVGLALRRAEAIVRASNRSAHPAGARPRAEWQISKIDSATCPGNG